MHFFEVMMLVCFGFSWPFSIAKSLRTHVVTGKSPLFMIIVIVGYACGITNKLLNGYNWVLWLYVVDTLLVAVDLALYCKYLPKEEEESAAIAKIEAEA